LLEQFGMPLILSVPWAASIAGWPTRAEDGFRFTGYIWTAQFALLIVLLVAGLKQPAPDRARFPSRRWQVWGAYLWCSLLWCNGWDRMNVQIACQITMPLMLGAVSAWCVRSEDQLKRLIRNYVSTLLPLLLVIIGTRVIMGNDPAGNRDAAMTVALIGCLLLSGLNRNFMTAYLSWAGCIALVLFSQSRMAAVSLTLLVIAHPLYKSVWRRLLAATVLGACGLAVFYSPTFQQRTFFEGSGSLTDLIEGLVTGKGVDTTGRAEAWPLIYEEAWKEPVLGHGVGSASLFVPQVWDLMAHPHNDYLRIGFEFGLVGLALFAFVIVSQLIDLVKRVKETDGAIQQAFAASMLGIVFFLIVAMTDNPLVYNLWYTDPLFVLMGAAYGAHHARTEAPAA